MSTQDTTDSGYMATTENTNTERDLMQLGCYLEDRGGVWVVQYAEGGCLPASITEKRLWNALQEARASLSLPAAGQEPVAPEASHLTGDAKLAHDQCRAVVHLAHALAEVYQANALILAAGQGPVEIIGQASAEVMEIVGDILNSTDAMDEEDTWLDPIYDAAQSRWPAERDAAPQPAVAAGWVSVDDRLPEPDEPVLAHNGKWTGVAAWMSGEYLEPLERWQDEHREFIEMMGPAITHWMKLPEPPNGTN